MRHEMKGKVERTKTVHVWKGRWVLCFPEVRVESESERHS